MELYLFGVAQWRTGEKSGIGPAMEFNYGVLADTQFHLVLPMAWDDQGNSGRHTGIGDTEIGVKYRIIHETDTIPQVGVFPMVELATGKAESGLGAGHTQVYLPVWIQKSWGPWTTYGGYGWWRNPGDGQRNWSFAGWLLQKEVSERLSLGAELFRSTSPQVLGQASAGFSFGGVVNLSEKHHLLFSLGRAVSGQRESHAYLGYQVTQAATGLAEVFRRSGK